ncbi:MAG: copper chaperone [Alphaproteobacteria bacterium]|nr:MAG: copper chaperone [Alphaproteobacteria bacterium]
MLLALLAAALDHAAVASAFEAQAVYTLQVDGLACPFCAYGIEKQLARLDGVQAVSTQIARGTVTIIMKPGATLTEKSAAKAVDKAGFTMRSFGRKGAE